MVRYGAVRCGAVESNYVRTTEVRFGSVARQDPRSSRCGGWAGRMCGRQ